MPGTWKGLLIASFAGGLCHAGQVCSLVFGKCPGEFSAGVLEVPASVIWLDARIPACSENIRVRTGSGAAAPSIVFVIDNSASMGTGKGGTDPDQARFRVVGDMLDSIYALSPAAEVGLVVFGHRLAFDHRDNAFFKTAFPEDTSQHDSFVPLTALDRDFGNGVRGLDTLKALLAYSGSGDLTYETRTPNSRPNGHVDDPADIRNGTDITLGFDAAKVALRDASAPKDAQYIIFLSDGDPSYLDEPRKDRENDFQRGEGVPATFTVFFTGSDRDTTAPKTIRTMTEAIRANGYSGTNPQSAYWAVGQPGIQLSTLLRNSVLNPIFTNLPARPVGAVLEAGGVPYAGSAADSSGFILSRRVPLQAGRTLVNLTYSYQYVDSGRTQTRQVPYVLTVEREAGGSVLPAGVSAACGEQGSLALYSRGAPVSSVNADQENLEVRLSPGDGETCAGCAAAVSPSSGPDRETVPLLPSAAGFKGTFARTISALPVAGDGTLQHSPADSIVLTYVNPENPLDVIRRAYPYSDASTRLTLERHNEWSRSPSAAGAPDRQFVLVAPDGFAPAATEVVNWATLPVLSGPADSLRYVGEIIEASRAFRVEIDIFSNLGQFVNRLAFTVPQSEFSKLPKGSGTGIRRLRVLWNARTREGNPAGTGAYIMKTAVSLLPVPGLSGDPAASADYRIVGVLRER